MARRPGVFLGPASLAFLLLLSSPEPPQSGEELQVTDNRLVDTAEHWSSPKAPSRRR